MNLETCLLTSFISNNNIISSCDFIPEQLNKGKVIYEVVRVIGTVPLFYNEHSERFYNSIRDYGLKIELPKRTLALRVNALIQTNKLIDGNIKFQLSFSKDKPEIFSAWVCPFFYPNNELYKTGIYVQTIIAQRNSPNIKLNNSKLARKASSIISGTNIYEVILVNSKGLITEGSRSNIFFVNDKKIYTPKISSVLPGVTRLKVIEATQNIDIKCFETDINLNNISKYQGAFITGTSPKVLPITNIDNIQFNPDHSTIKKIMNEYNKLVAKDISSFSW